MRHIKPILVFVSLTLLVGYFFGTHLENSNPDGVWLYTPPAVGSAEPASSFQVGAVVGIFLGAVSLAAVGVSSFTWARLGNKALHPLCMPLFLSSALGLILAAVFGAGA